MCVYSSINNTHLEAQSIKNDCFEYTMMVYFVYRVTPSYLSVDAYCLRFTFLIDFI